MLKFLKGLVMAAPPPARTRARPRPNDRGPAANPPRAASFAPAPVPEVIEGNDEKDWALWEDSVVALDSQMQPLGGRASAYQSLLPSQYDELDAYARVGKNRDL
jgi:hypothetical protein